MKLVGTAQRFGDHPNAFGFLRLLFASLVIVSHCYETTNGPHGWEPLVSTFGTISLGTLSVYAFFIISGYLITSSLMNSPTAVTYLIKRVARIYPGFIVASLLCLLVVAPLAGRIGSIPHAVLLGLIHIVALQPPETEAPFNGTYFPVLNGSMWTIAYEFRSYLLVLVLSGIGALRRPWLIAILAIIALLVAKFTPATFIERFNSAVGHPGLWFGLFMSAFTFFSMFLSGAAYYLFRHRIPLSPAFALAALLGVVAGLSLRPITEVSFALFGSYLIFYTATQGAKTFLRNVNNETDISYGVYLYGWPLMKLVQMYLIATPIPLTIVVTYLLAIVLGWASWVLIEKPALEIARCWLRSKGLTARRLTNGLEPVSPPDELRLIEKG